MEIPRGAVLRNITIFMILLAICGVYIHSAIASEAQWGPGAGGGIVTGRVAIPEGRAGALRVALELTNRVLKNSI